MGCACASSRIHKKNLIARENDHTGGAEERRWRSSQSPSLDFTQMFFNRVFNKIGPQGWLSIVVMELGESPACLAASYFVVAESSGATLLPMITIFASYSPGTMLIPTIVDYGFSHGYTEYDFLSGEEPYKMQWITGFHRTYRLLVWNRRWISRASRQCAYLKLRMRRQCMRRSNEPKRLI